VIQEARHLGCEGDRHDRCRAESSAICIELDEPKRSQGVRRRRRRRRPSEQESEVLASLAQELGVEK
jgi:hypothetical protein